MKNKLWLGFPILLMTCCTTKPIVSEITATHGAEMSIHYLALGDSYTIGESVSERERFPNQLADLMTKQGQPLDVTIIARTGWTTNELWEGIQKSDLKPSYDFVTLLIGVNNQYRGYQIGEYQDEFQFLLKKSIEYAGGDKDRVFVLSIPDWGVTPFAAGRNATQIASEIDSFNSVNRKETESAGVQYLDITPISRQAANDPSLIAHDGLHPSATMYALWVQQLLPQVVEMLANKKN